MADIEKARRLAHERMERYSGSGLVSTEVRRGQEMALVLESLVQDVEHEILKKVDERFDEVESALDGLIKVLERIEGHYPPAPSTSNGVTATVRFGWGSSIATYPNTPNSKEVITMSDVSFSDASSGETGTLTVLDAAGNSFVPTTPPVWTPDSTTFVSLDVAADGMSATAVPVTGGGVGTTNVTIQITNNDGTAAEPYVTSVTTTASDEASAAVSWAPIVPASQTPSAPVSTDTEAAPPA